MRVIKQDYTLGCVIAPKATLKTSFSIHANPDELNDPEAVVRVMAAIDRLQHQIGVAINDAALGITRDQHGRVISSLIERPT